MNDCQTLFVMKIIKNTVVMKLTTFIVVLSAFRTSIYHKVIQLYRNFLILKKCIKFNQVKDDSF